MVVGRDGEVAAEGEDVLDALCPVVDEDVADVGAGVALAREVRHRRDRRLPPHPAHQIGRTGAGTTPCPVRDAHVVGRQWFELGDGAPEAQPTRLVLGREELE